jgi:hypothetical protein
MAWTFRFVSPLLIASFVACGEEPETETDPGPDPNPDPDTACEADTDCDDDAPLCDVEVGACEALPPGAPIGWRDGAADSVDFTVVLDPGQVLNSTDLGFDPTNPETLWVVNYKDDSVFVVTRPGQADMEWERIKDPAASHFMNAPPALAFGDVLPQYGQTFGVCGDSDNGGNDFMGPALFSSNLDVFATQNPDTGLGSHLDMLHSTSYCRGIAFAGNNTYFLFNSDKGSIDKYLFHAEHAPGEDDHSDGEIYRYGSSTVTGVDGIPSHVVYDPASMLLYIADTGSGRVLALDTMSGTEGSSFSGNEPANRTRIDDAVFSDVVAQGTLESPAGIELHQDLLYVSDNAQSRFYAFDLQGSLVRTLDTGLPAGSLAGFTFGPDGKVYFVDMLTSRVHRVDPK